MHLFGGVGFGSYAEGGVPLDPTNRFGELSPWPEGSWWPFPDNVTLARVNEPSPGSSVSVEGNTVGRLGRKVVFVTTRDVQEGEELFMDYGRSFDRSGYGDY